jgi:hypothetical protein
MHNVAAIQIQLNQRSGQNYWSTKWLEVALVADQWHKTAKPNFLSSRVCNRVKHDAVWNQTMEHCSGMKAKYGPS